jgi:drug/metabolite transporter (DMT)-like permease
MLFIKSLLFERHLSYLQAALWSTFGYFMFSLSDSFGKWLMSEGFTKSFILVANSIPALVIFTILAVKRHGFKRAYHTRYPQLHLLRCVALIAITFFIFEALKLLPLTEFYGLSFSVPFIVTLGALIFFKERVDIKEWAAIIVGFGGVIVIINPEYSTFNMGHIYAICGVLCIAGATLIVRKIGRDEDPYLYVIFGNIGIILANLIPAFNSALPDIITAEHIIAFTVYSFTIPTAIFVMSTVFARAPTISAVAPYQYLQIIWGTIIGFLVFSEIPKINVVLGSIVVIACGLFILNHHAQQRKIKPK